MNKHTHADTMRAIKAADNYQLRELCKMSVGRVLSIGSRPGKPSDVMEYEKYKWFIMEASQELRERGQL